MQISKRRATVIATALILGGAGVAAQPAIAKDPKGSIDSREIKNGTIRVNDLNTLLKTRVAQAKTALQEIPDASVTTPKLADDAVTNPKLADNSVGAAEVTDGTIGAPEIGPNAVNSEELANDSVDTGAVADGSLQAVDISSVRGVTNLDFPLIGAGSCQVLPIVTGNALNNDIILITPGPTMPGIVTVEGRQQNINSTQINVLACNHSGVNLNPAPTDISWAVLEN